LIASSRVVAQGADRFRRPGVIERLADRLARMPISPFLRRQLKRLYQAVLEVQTRGRGLPRVLPGGETIRVSPEYAYVSWNPDEYRAFREAVRPGMVALDVGANVGAYSTLFGRWVGPSGSVFAFEPAPRIFQGLVRHIELNHLSAVVRPICSAVGEVPATARLVVAGSAGESRLAIASDGDARTIPVPVTTIDEFCARERIAPDFIKIDVEGSELAVLRGARETIRARRGKLALFVEMHASAWPALGVSRDDLIAELRTLSLAAEPLTPTSEMWTLEGICLRLVEI
jgi:FkbM family methyltransferase